MSNTARAVETERTRPEGRVDYGRVARTVGAWTLLIAATVVVAPHGFGADAWVYADAWNHGGLYEGSPIVGLGNYLYSPAFAQVIWPLVTFGTAELFVRVWYLLALAAFAWLLWPLQPRYRFPLLGAAAMVATIGNIEWLLAGAAAIGLRYPPAWAAVLLTKVTPGAGVLWFAARGEWRAFAIAVGATAGIVLASAILAPHLWVEWVAMLLANGSEGRDYQWVGPRIPLGVRVALAAVLVVWGARTGRPWTVAVALVLGQPDINPWSFGMLAAVPRLSHVEVRCLVDARLTRPAEEGRVAGPHIAY